MQRLSSFSKFLFWKAKYKFFDFRHKIQVRFEFFFCYADWGLTSAKHDASVLHNFRSSRGSARNASYSVCRSAGTSHVFPSKHTSILRLHLSIYARDALREAHFWFFLCIAFASSVSRCAFVCL